MWGVRFGGNLASDSWNRDRHLHPNRWTANMSRAFVRDDAGDYVAPGRFGLPPVSDPDFDAAAARALIEAARDANTESAEVATGYRWGEPKLRRHVRRLLEDAESVPEQEQDRRYIRVARRFLGEL